MKETTGSSTPVEAHSEADGVFPQSFRELLHIQKQFAAEQAVAWGKNVLAVGAVVVGSGIVAYPIAEELGIQHTTVEADIINAPAELQFTGNGLSTLQLGSLGSYYTPQHQNGIGISAEVKDTPTAGSGSLEDYFSPQFLNVVTSLFHDPETAIEDYADLLKAEARANVTDYLQLGTLALSGIILAPLLLRKDWREAIKSHKRLSAAAGLSLMAAGYGATTLIADNLREDWAAQSPRPENPQPIKGLQGTDLEGTVASNKLLQIATNEAVPSFRKNIERQELATDTFVTAATESLLQQTDNMAGPREGESVTMSLADTHGNQAMLTVLATLHDSYITQWGDGAIEYITVSGDLTTSGAVAERSFIKDVVEIGYGPDEESTDDDTPVVAISGDHEKPVSIEQMRGAGMINPDRETVEVADATILGANDTAQKDLGGSKIDEFIDGINEHELGELIRQIAESDEPDAVLLHQAYAVMSFLGIDAQGIASQSQMTDFLENNGPNDVYLTEYRDDNIANIPTKQIRYGHWHRSVPMRVIWNEDPLTGKITWTTVEEINTSTGSIGNPTLGRFSLPWYPPLQNAVIRMNFSNVDSGLTTGYQEYTFRPDGSLEISPRVEIGLPGGQPGYARFVKDASGKPRFVSLMLPDRSSK